MFEVGFSELLMIGLVSLLVIGPERLPKVARTVGLWLGRIRAISANLKAEIHHELELAEMKELLQQQQRQFEEQLQQQRMQLYAVKDDVEQLSDLEHLETEPDKNLTGLKDLSGLGTNSNDAK